MIQIYTYTKNIYIIDLLTKSDYRKVIYVIEATLNEQLISLKRSWLLKICEFGQFYNNAKHLFNRRIRTISRYSRFSQSWDDLGWWSLKTIFLYLILWLNCFKFFTWDDSTGIIKKISVVISYRKKYIYIYVYIFDVFLNSSCKKTMRSSSNDNTYANEKNK